MTVFSILKDCFNFKRNSLAIFVRSSDRYKPIDGIRGLSMLYVLITHALVMFIIDGDPAVIQFVQTLPPYLQWLLMGDKAVDAFFVISGFLIGEILFRQLKRTQDIAFGQFYLRRLLRLTPVYWVFLGLFLVFAVEGVENENIFYYAIYFNNFLEEQHRYLPWLWSLAVEEQFYLVFPLIIYVLFKWTKSPLKLLIFLLVLSLTIRFVILWLNPELLVSGDVLIISDSPVHKLYNQLLYINTYTRFGPFIMGAMIAYCWVFYQSVLLSKLNKTNQYRLLFILLLFTVGFALLPIYRPSELPNWVYYIYHTAHRHVFAFMVCIVILISLNPLGKSRWISKFLSSRWIYPFAQLSYPMYLIHLPLLLMTFTLIKSVYPEFIFSLPALFILSFTCLLPILIVAITLNLFFEAPFIRLRFYLDKPKGRYKLVEEKLR